jgi:hypothetical protein
MCGIRQEKMAFDRQHSNKLLRNLLILVVCFAVLMVGFKVLVTSSNPLGADFSIYWTAARQLFLHQVSPYDPATTEKIQMGIYGRLAKPTEDQVRYAYPPFSLLAVLPSAGMTYPWAEAYWMALNLVAVVLGVLAVNRKPPVWLLAGLVFFYPVSRGVILGQFALLIGAGLMMAYGILNGDRPPARLNQWLSGILLAWCAMKPHLSGVVIAFIVLQSIRRRQWRVLAGLFTGGMALALISWIWVPTWVGDWIKLIFAYVGYVPIKPILGSWLAMFGIDWVTLWVRILLGAIALGITFWLFSFWWKKRLPDFLPLGWLILVNQLVNPNPNSLLSDQIVFLIPLLIWLCQEQGIKWVRIITWWGFVLIPWILFGMFFAGKEPYAVASGLALIYLIWWLFCFCFMIFQKRFSPRQIADN